jgi:hypothetical protein
MARPFVGRHAGLVLLLACGAAGLGLRGPADPTPACKVELAPASAAFHLRVRVGERELDLGPVDWEPKELRVYPDGTGAVLVAYRGSDGETPQGGSTLWRIPCAEGPADRFAEMEGADFGHAALAPDARTLFFTGPDGVFALDLATRATRRITRASSPYCEKNDVDTRDVVEGWEEGALHVERGCGYEHGWHAQSMRIEEPGAARATVLPAPRAPLAAVAVDAGGGLWLSDGSCEDPSTFGRVLFSPDRGAHWRNIPVARAARFPVQPIRQVIADRTAPGAVLFFTMSCGSAAHVDPAWVFVTEDGGRTSRPIAVPPGVPTGEERGPASEQDPIQAVEAPDGSLSYLVLYGQSEQVTGDRVARWESRDGGRSWTSLAPVRAAPEPTPQAAAAGGLSFAIRRDGLYRSGGGEPPLRVYPPGPGATRPSAAAAEGAPEPGPPRPPHP